MLIITIVGFICCEHESKKTIELNSQITEGTTDNINKTIETEIDEDGDTSQAVQPVSLGVFKLTAYCPCAKCCGRWAYNRPNGIIYGAIGEELKEGYSIAVDPNVIPYGTKVIINGHTYIAHDTGGAIEGNHIDIYFDDHQKALKFGVQYDDVYMVQENKIIFQPKSY